MYYTMYEVIEPLYAYSLILLSLEQSYLSVLVYRDMDLFLVVLFVPSAILLLLTRKRKRQRIF